VQKAPKLTWAAIKMLLSCRMLVGIYIGQYCITTLTWFFLTWFPVYLSQARHMSIMKVGVMAALPALCGFVGGILGGVVSDKLLQAGHTLTFARKAPIVFGMLLSMTMIGCNYANAQWVVMVLYGIAAALFAYCVSLLMSSPLASFAAAAGYQMVLFVVRSFDRVVVSIYDPLRY